MINMEQEISYRLTQEEVEQGLRLFQKLLHGRRIMVETIVLAVMSVFFLVSFILNVQWFNLAMCCLCLAVIAALQILPRLELKQMVPHARRDIRLQLLADDGALRVWAEDGEADVPLNRSTKMKHVSDMIVMAPKKGGMLIIPQRAMDSKILLKAINEVEDE